MTKRFKVELPRQEGEFLEPSAAEADLSVLAPTRSSRPSRSAVRSRSRVSLMRLKIRKTRKKL